MYMSLDEFMKEAKARINRVLVNKMKLLGYYEDEILHGNDPTKKPQMMRAVLENTDDYIHEEFSVNGIRLFTVTWSKGECLIEDSAV